jgi:hypothetical protein
MIEDFYPINSNLWQVTSRPALYPPYKVFIIPKKWLCSLFGFICAIAPIQVIAMCPFEWQYGCDDYFCGIQYILNFLLLRFTKEWLQIMTMSYGLQKQKNLLFNFLLIDFWYQWLWPCSLMTKCFLTSLFSGAHPFLRLTVQLKHFCWSYWNLALFSTSNPFFRNNTHL